MSSFRKRNVQVPIRGTRTSPQTGQVITSSGNPSLDVILGGGLPIGSICLIEEDKYVTHARVLAKYFLAEGIASAQTVFLGSLDDDPNELIYKLPKPIEQDEYEKENDVNTSVASAEERKDEGDAIAAKNGLRIAWRYNDLPLVNSEHTTVKIGHHFNLLEYMDRDFISFARTLTWNDAATGITVVATGDATTAADDMDDDELDEVTVSATVKDSLSATSNHNEMPVSVDVNPIGPCGDVLSVPTDTVAPMDLDAVPPKKPLAAEGGSDGESEALSYSDAALLTTPPLPLPLPPPPPPQPIKAGAGTECDANGEQLKIFESGKYLSVLRRVHGLLREEQFYAKQSPRNLCRVCITSLGSPAWYDDIHYCKDMLKFLTILRSEVRDASAVCFITMPMRLVAKRDETLVEKIRNLVDYSIELESFDGDERATCPELRNYHGLLHLRKMAAINTLCAYMPETADLAFKLRRKKFVIEKIHLSPELGEDATSDGSMDTTTINCGVGISPNPKSLLDF